MKPSSVLSSVLLPAPFGPSRPTAPAGNDAVTSFRARCLPYRTVRFLMVTTGSVEVIAHAHQLDTEAAGRLFTAARRSQKPEARRSRSQKPASVPPSGF